LFVPSATPPAVVSRLRDAMRETMADGETRRVFEAAGSPPAYLDQAEFAAFIQKDSARLIEAVRKIGRIEGG
jgi:tripartite-type tricarboxylate transporter receptor subunit TctC